MYIDLYTVCSNFSCS